MINEENLIIRTAVWEDAGTVTSLLAKLGLITPAESQIEDHWKRVWHDNPYYRFFDDEVHYGWVMEYEGCTVGFFGSFPRIYHLNGKPFRATIATQWGVEKEFRKYTDLLCRKFFNENPIPTKLVTTAIKPTGKIFERYDGCPVPSPDLTTVYMVPLRLERLLALKSSSYIKQPLILKWLRSSLQVITAPWRWHYRFLKKSNNVSELNVASAGQDFEEFWQTYLKQSSGLVACRSLPSIQWFYKGGFRNLSSNVFVYKKDGKIEGYMSLMKEPVKDGTLSRYKIIDLLALSADVKEALVKYAIRYCYDMKADVLEFHLTGLLQKKDIPVFTLSRQVPSWPFYFQTSDPELKALLKKEDMWQTSSYDGDVALC